MYIDQCYLDSDYRDSSLDDRARQQSLKLQCNVLPITGFVRHTIHICIVCLMKPVTGKTLHWNLSDCWRARSSKEESIQSELSMPNIIHDFIWNLLSFRRFLLGSMSSMFPYIPYPLISSSPHSSHSESNGNWHSCTQTSIEDASAVFLAKEHGKGSYRGSMCAGVVMHG